ncbi:cytochrome (ubi)quinol oxidase subunit III [Bartonella schoenbuchensis]|uniref:Cytochrome bo(3) ubiquinol oxidase subunit 3 n=2 Tax=Bartonella schoenbuchensis TaxID=165694 RepID=E6YXQ8_BARSR|nr:cytochrome (ubi)quinol oxidase subunit III [Bartonella schoenbuchensis]AQX30078.1 cytochrome bo3 quinol oxidase subunit 3 [Bartonella schoenbuchensis R1]CBI81646.1 cytochrome o ubiquinol oxidase subunit III [Bartonella schoenbuchensis R1]CDP79166.1 cytochrome o ubiquinol oxidase subunit III [Bartonella schoenbuchensis]
MSAVTMNNVCADEHHHDNSSVMIFGFWIYILSDLIVFATLFSGFAVFSASYGGGKAGSEFIHLNFVLVETAILLLSSITYGFVMVQTHKGNLAGVRLWMAITFVLGSCFIGMEIYEFRELLSEVYYYDAGAYAGVDLTTGTQLFGREVLSAYWSAFFALVGTHGLHVSVGLLWMIVMFFHLCRSGLDQNNKTRLTCLSIFWHLLDIVWVGVFTMVYLLGAL